MLQEHSGAINRRVERHTHSMINQRCFEMVDAMLNIAAVNGSVDADLLFKAGFSDDEIKKLGKKAAAIAADLSEYVLNMDRVGGV